MIYGVHLFGLVRLDRDFDGEQIEFDFIFCKKVLFISVMIKKVKKYFFIKNHMI